MPIENVSEQIEFSFKNHLFSDQIVLLFNIQFWKIFEERSVFIFFNWNETNSRLLSVSSSVSMRSNLWIRSVVGRCEWMWIHKFANCESTWIHKNCESGCFRPYQPKPINKSVEFEKEFPKSHWKQQILTPFPFFHSPSLWLNFNYAFKRRVRCKNSQSLYG